MTNVLAVGLASLLLTAASPDQTQTERKRNPIAPSLRELTEKEEKEVERIIDQFILYDSGQIKDVDGKKIVKEFQSLGPDAIPALIHGMNKAARIDHSCPAVTIRNKLRKMLKASYDVLLLEYARENIGAGVERSRHMNMLKDLKVTCMLRKRVVEKAAARVLAEPSLKGDSLTNPEPERKPAREMSVAELIEAAGKEEGSRLRGVLTELGRRSDSRIISALAAAADNHDGPIQKLARELLDKQVANLKDTELKEKLKDERGEVRASACRTAAAKGLRWEDELIELLIDSDADVRQAARKALVKFNKGVDFGPAPTAGALERYEAASKWRQWMEHRKER